MGFWLDFLDGVADGAIRLSAYQMQAAQNCTRAYEGIDSLCRQLNWHIAERHQGFVGVHFTTGRYQRAVYISDNDSPLVSCGTYSLAETRMQTIPPDILAYLLHRNETGYRMCRWGIHVTDDEAVWFRFGYTALRDALNANALQFICDSLLEEVADFDSKLRQQGLLR